jgi:acyl carrier protein
MTSDSTRSNLEQIGVGALDPDIALRSLESLLGAQRVQVTVAEVDWRVFSQIYSAKARRHLLDELAPVLVNAPEAEEEDLAGEEPLIAKLSLCPAENRRDVMAAHVQQAVAIALGVDPPSRVGFDRGFFDLGMDSLMAVDLRRRLEASVGRPLPPTLAFDYPSVEVLADWLLELLFPAERVAPSDAGKLRPTGGTDLLADLESLSDEEVDALFAQKVAGQDRS